MIASRYRSALDPAVAFDRRVARRLARRFRGRFQVERVRGRRLYVLTGEAGRRAILEARAWREARP